MEKSATKEIRTGGIWYTHSQVLDGYTNRGQVLGAGIGPGSNLQSLDINWVKGLKRLVYNWNVWSITTIGCTELLQVLEDIG